MMNLFSKPAMAEPTVTGVDVLRATVKARNRSPHAMSLIAREIDGVSASTLEDFAAGKADLSVATLKALTKLFYPNAEYDEELNLLRSLAKEAKPIGIKPPAYNPERHSPHHPPAAPRTRGAATIASVKPAPPAKPTGRPGWAKGW